MISREKLLEAMRDEITLAKNTNMPQFVAGLFQALEVIENQDEIEGEWLEASMDYMCSHCKEKINDEVVYITDGLPRFCPFCGAEMNRR